MPRSERKKKKRVEVKDVAPKGEGPKGGALGDGSVRFIKDSISSGVFYSTATTSGKSS